MFERAPNGFFVRNLIVFNLLRRGGYVAKGFVFEAPDLTNSQVADLNDFQDQLCLLLASLYALLAGHVRTQTPPSARHYLHLALAGKRAEFISVRRRPARLLPHAARPA